MILLVTQRPAPPGEIVTLRAEGVDTVLEALKAQPYERIVVDGLDAGINPFDLARRLREYDAPPLVLAGELRDDQRFWAERNGCHRANDLDEALSLEI
ncbi:MAG: hypothetical protein JRF33_21225 [Deltaproteobacteria bacterium]|nr:hypothetical protein [Deltaproteobacteria bacterium]